MKDKVGSTEILKVISPSDASLGKAVRLQSVNGLRGDGSAPGGKSPLGWGDLRVMMTNTVCTP